MEALPESLESPRDSIYLQQPKQEVSAHIDTDRGCQRKLPATIRCSLAGPAHVDWAAPSRRLAWTLDLSEAIEHIR